MAAMSGNLYGRKASLLLVQGDKALDLSEMHFRFKSSQEDAESPGNCEIRIWNLSEPTIKAIRGEYARVVLQAGYDEAPFGVIFDGTIKQYRIGREPDAVNTYLDILAADGDLAYNFAFCSRTLAAGSSSRDRTLAAIATMEGKGVLSGEVLLPSTGGILPRGKVLFGMAKAVIRSEAQSMQSTWSIQNGRVNVIPLSGFLPGEAVVLNSLSGLIGRPEQTIDGLRVRCLINPRIRVGGLVQIDNKSINQILQQNPEAAPVVYNQYAGLQQLATVTADGIYRVYVVENTGDTRGQEWYSDLVCLTVDPVTQTVKAYG